MTTAAGYVAPAAYQTTTTTAAAEAVITAAPTTTGGACPSESSLLSLFSTRLPSLLVADIPPLLFLSIKVPDVSRDPSPARILDREERSSPFPRSDEFVPTR